MSNLAWLRSTPGVSVLTALIWAFGIASAPSGSSVAISSLASSSPSAPLVSRHERDRERADGLGDPEHRLLDARRREACGLLLRRLEDVRVELEQPDELRSPPEPRPRSESATACPKNVGSGRRNHDFWSARQAVITARPSPLPSTRNARFSLGGGPSDSSSAPSSSSSRPRESTLPEKQALISTRTLSALIARSLVRRADSDSAVDSTSVVGPRDDLRVTCREVVLARLPDQPMTGVEDEHGGTHRGPDRERIELLTDPREGRIAVAQQDDVVLRVAGDVVVAEGRRDRLGVVGRAGRGHPRLVVGADADDQGVAVVEAHRERRGFDIASPSSTPHPPCVPGEDARSVGTGQPLSRAARETRMCCHVPMDRRGRGRRRPAARPRQRR